MRVAQVIACEPVKKADKLLKLQLDLGYEQRQVVSGIAKFYTPEELVGRKVICIVNLKPVKLRGELSQGMILAASKGEQLTIATVPDSMPNGAIRNRDAKSIRIVTVQQSPQARGSGDCFFCSELTVHRKPCRLAKCRSELTYRKHYYYNSNSKFYDLRGR